MKPIVFEAYPEIEDMLDKYISDQLRIITAVPKATPKTGSKSMIDYSNWVATQEGRLHMQLMVKYVLSAEHIDAKMANKIQRKLQSQGRESRGRPRKFDSRLHDWTTQRQLRLFILNRLLATGLGVETDEWTPPFAEDVAMLDSTTPDDMYHALQRFEEWSEIVLPKAAWMLYTRSERQALSATYPDLEKEPDGGILLEEFSRLRRIPVTQIDSIKAA